ncbi:hypothetical protein JCM8097_000264 [Rhodosporidiobolus ruineniae]
MALLLDPRPNPVSARQRRNSPSPSPGRRPPSRSSNRGSSASRTRLTPRTSLTNVVKEAAEPAKKPEEKPKKRVGVIGAGTGGIGALLALLDLPESTREGWTIEVLERREDVGGIWLPDEHDHPADSIPETPLYPALHTNTAVPTMTYTGLPFPPNTPLFPNHSHIKAYLSSVVSRAKLAPYLRFGETIEHAAYEDGRWVVQVAHAGAGKKDDENGGPWTEVKEFDHLVVATGRYHHPNLVRWDGQEEWLAAASSSPSGAGSSRPDREVVHSLWYRGPEKYKARTVVVVGFGASGWDIATQVQTTAEKLYHSYTPHPDAPTQLPPVPGTIYKPRLSHFTPDAIYFEDGTLIPTSPDSRVSIVLATGYSLSIPFLSPHLLQQAPLKAAEPLPSTLTTNGTYLRPLFRDLLVLDPRIPPNALGVIGLPWFIAAAQGSYIQGLVLAHAFANEKETQLLPEETRDGALKELEEFEDRRRKEEGAEPFEIGHKFLSLGQAEAYQDALLTLIRSHSLIPLPSRLASPSTPYVPDWRRWGRANTIRLRRAFLLAVEEGIEAERFRAKEGTEEEWIRTLEALNEWYEGKEREEEEAKGHLEELLREKEDKENRPLVVLGEQEQAAPVKVTA